MIVMNFNGLSMQVLSDVEWGIQQGSYGDDQSDLLCQYLMGVATVSTFFLFCANCCVHLGKVTLNYLVVGNSRTELSKARDSVNWKYF